MMPVITKRVTPEVWVRLYDLHASTIETGQGKALILTDAADARELEKRVKEAAKRLEKGR